MISRRASRITRRSKQHEYYSDFLYNFDLNPVMGALERVVNEESVKRSIENLVQTRQGERFYHSEVGSDINLYLFQPLSQATALLIQQSIDNTIKRFEPRAQDVKVTVVPDEINNALIVDVQFTVINIPTVVNTMQIILNRVR